MLPTCPFSFYRFRLLLGMVIVLIVINSMIAFSFNVGHNMTSKYTPLMDAVMMIKLESTNSHILLEELINKDKELEFDAVNNRIENAIWYANAMLSGGTNEEGVFLALENRDLESKVNDLLKDLHVFKILTKNRYENKDILSTKSDLENVYDDSFIELVSKSNEIEEELREIIKSELHSYTLAYYMLLAGASTLIIGVTLLLFKYEREKNKNLMLLTESHDTLKVYQERMDLAFTGSNDGLWDWNVQDDTIYFSPRWKSMIGYEDDELENCFTAWHERIHPEDVKQTDEDMQSHLSRKTKIYENTHRLKHKDGSWVWISVRGKAQFDDAGRSIRFIGTNRDVTQEKNLQNNLKLLNDTLEEQVKKQVEEITKSNQMLESIFETTKNGIAIINLKSEFLLVNSAYENLTGFNSEELYKRSYFSLSKPEEIEKFKKILETTLNKGYFGGYERLCLGKDGKYIETRVEITLMPDKKSFLTLTKNITKENKYKKERHQQEEYLLQQSRMAQMGEMISMIAHQWRQPLSAISACSIRMQLDIELNQIDLYEEKELKKYEENLVNGLNSIDRFVQNLTSTIDDFRNFYKPNKETVTTLISNPIQKALNIIIASLSSHNIEIEKIYESKKMISMHDNEMMQVILNILKNAQDNFIEKNTIKPKITIMTKDSEQGAIIEICDNGGGIHEDVILNIFTPYFSTKSEKNGTGLGLYMSKMIVESHHKGSLSAQNIENGVCFIIEMNENIYSAEN